MKIALVSGEYPPMEGGVGAFTQELGKALAQLGQEVYVITSKDALPEDAGRNHRGRHAEPYPLDYGSLYAVIDRWRWPSTARVADLTLREEFDVVNIQYQAAAYNMHSAAANLMPWRLKHLTRTIVTFHDLRTPYLFPKAGSLRSSAVTFMARQSGGVIATNVADYQALRPRLTSPLENIPIGSNIQPYLPNHLEISSARQDLGLQEGDNLIAYFGFLNQSKGADILVESLAQLPPDYHLVFIGGETGASDETNASFVAQVKQQIEDLGLAERIHWTGFLSDVRVSTFLCTADLVALPYQDGVSLRRGTLMAALAHGRPVISTISDQPLPELIHGSNIWLVPPGEVDKLAAGIRELMTDSGLRRQLGNEAAVLAGQFSWDEIAARTLAFYQSIDDPRKERV